MQDTGKLIARADAAIAEAKRLHEINLNWQEVTARNIDRLFHTWRFEMSERPTCYPQDFPERRELCQPFPAADDQS